MSRTSKFKINKPVLRSNGSSHTQPNHNKIGASPARRLNNPHTNHCNALLIIAQDTDQPTVPENGLTELGSFISNQN